MSAKHYIALFVVAVLLCGCNPDEACRKDRNSVVGVQFYQVVFNQTSEQYVNESTTRGLSVKPIGSDSVLYNGSISSLSLPLRRVDATTAFLLTDTLTMVSDTLSFIYSVEDDFVSLECGCVPSFNIASAQVTYHQIDSVVVVQPAVTTTAVTNVNLYFKNSSN